MKKIPLGQSGKFALVDDEDYVFLMQWDWFLSKAGYAVRSKILGKEGEKYIRKTFWMHREVNVTDEKYQTDHINCDKLDNRRKNLRSATAKENQGNKRPQRGTSAYKGVGWVERRKKWRSYIKINGKQKSLGYFSYQEEAAIAYNEDAIK